MKLKENDWKLKKKNKTINENKNRLDKIGILIRPPVSGQDVLMKWSPSNSALMVTSAGLLWDYSRITFCSRLDHFGPQSGIIQRSLGGARSGFGAASETNSRNYYFVMKTTISLPRNLLEHFWKLPDDNCFRWLPENLPEHFRNLPELQHLG